MKISDLFSSKAIDDVIYLGQFFYLVLFFECYSLITKNQSIVNSELSIESITLKPFFFYLIFLGILRVTWFFTTWIKTLLMSWIFPKAEINDLSVRSSFTIFLVLISMIIYSIIILKNPSYVPIIKEHHWILFNLYNAVFSLGTMFMFYIYLFTIPFFEGNNKK